jgi:hypothetical protein
VADLPIGLFGEGPRRGGRADCRGDGPQSVAAVVSRGAVRISPTKDLPRIEAPTLLLAGAWIPGGGIAFPGACPTHLREAALVIPGMNRAKPEAPETARAGPPSGSRITSGCNRLAPVALQPSPVDPPAARNH